MPTLHEIEAEERAFAEVRLLMDELCQIAAEYDFRRIGDGEGGWLHGLLDSYYEAHAGRPMRTRRVEAPTPSRPAIGMNKRLAIARRDGFRCVKCEAEDDLSIDHIVPVSKGGSDEIDNLRLLCRPCNSRKGAKL